MYHQRVAVTAPVGVGNHAIMRAAKNSWSACAKQAMLLRPARLVGGIIAITKASYRHPKDHLPGTAQLVARQAGRIKQDEPCRTPLLERRIEYQQREVELAQNVAFYIAMLTSSSDPTDRMTALHPTLKLSCLPSAEPRRSASIFSRRGETPEPTPAIAQAAMLLPKPMTEKHKHWLVKTRSLDESTSPTSQKSARSAKRPKATVLKAVPQVKGRKSTALESAMAASLNVAVSAAVSGSASESSPETPQSKNSGPSILLRNAWKGSTKFEKRKSAEHRVGVWVEGVTEWDAAMKYRAVLDAQRTADEKMTEEFGPTSIRRVPVKAAATLGVRPNLSVVIPQPKEEMTWSTLAVETQPIASGEPATLPMSKFNDIAPMMALDEDSQFPSPELEPEFRSPTLEPTMLVTENRNAEKPKDQPSVSRTSSKSSSGVGGGYASSADSKRSSATSLETGSKLSGSARRRLSGNTLVEKLNEPSVKRAARGSPNSKPADVNKPLPPAPRPPSSRDALQPPSGSNIKRPLRQSRSISSASENSSLRYRSRKLTGRSRSWNHLETRLDVLDHEFMATAPSSNTSHISSPSSPTLTQAEDALEAHLNTLTGTSPDVEEPMPEWPPQNLLQVNQKAPSAAQDPLQRETIHESPVTGEIDIAVQKTSVSAVLSPPECAPVLPKRSRKREWRMSPRPNHVSQVATIEPLKRRRSASEALLPQDNEKAQSIVRRCTVSTSEIYRGAPPESTVPQHHDLAPINELDTFKEAIIPQITFDDGLIVVHGPVVLGEDGRELHLAAVAAATAEEVLLHILSFLDSTGDLLNTAMMNRGMYRVFKENEMHLIRMVTYNDSPAAWELREWCPLQRDAAETDSSSSSIILEHTPTTYIQCLRRDDKVIANLKATLLRECPTCIRKETAAAFSDPSCPDNQRFNDAFWRIWCFCKIFGCEKGREEDIAGQLDWLKGGVIANNRGFSATVNTNWEVDMSSVLFNPPECFAKGNGGGLTAEQLYDMIEIWTCLTTLLQSYQGRTDQARAAGVYDDCDVEEGDQEKEELMLEEWIYYLLTLGPNVVLEMTELATNDSSAGFAHAIQNAWTIWSPPPVSASRRTFLKDPVSRLYEERICAATLSPQSSHDRKAKEMAKRRVATLAAEIKLARQNSAYGRRPYIDMSTERPMSMASRSDSTSSAPSERSNVSPYTTGMRTPMTPSLAPASMPESPTWWSPRKISPIVEDCGDSFGRLTLQKRPTMQPDPSRKAIRKIMDMGFSLDEAEWALKMTETASGLQVERAVDMLLNQRE